MQCPHCSSTLYRERYEGIEIDACPVCRGQWLDAYELGRLVQLRERRFDPAEQEALAQAPAVRGVPLEDSERDLSCPACGAPTYAMNYGGDTGVIIDRCTRCRGFWLEGGELDHIQMLIEAWERQLPQDLAAYSPLLNRVAQRINDDLRVKLPRLGRFASALVNGIVDLT